MPLQAKPQKLQQIEIIKIRDLANFISSESEVLKQYLEIRVFNLFILK